MYSLIRKPLLLIPVLLFLGVSSVSFGETPKVQSDNDVAIRVYVGPGYRHNYWRPNYRPYYYDNYYGPYRYQTSYPYWYNNDPYYWDRGYYRGNSGFYFRIR